MTKKVKPEKKTKPADKTPEVTKAAKALEKYLKENNLDPAKDWSKDKTHGKEVTKLLAKLNKERDKVAAKYPEKDEANQAKLVKMNEKEKAEKAAKKAEKEKKKKASGTGKKATKYDYPLVDGREMTSDEKKKYRMEQRRLAAGKAPKEEKPKEKKAKKEESKPSKKIKKAKKKASHSSREED